MSSPVTFRLGRRSQSWNDVLEFLWALNSGEVGADASTPCVDVEMLQPEGLEDLLCNHLVSPPLMLAQ
jgi:hypothetical protein